jgi:anti-anti-sigma regulatory factor
MLRIERVHNGAGKTTVRATGRLSGPWIAELERSLADQAPDDVVVLDLTDVSFVDREGIEFLRMLRRLELVDLRCSAFVAEQIN